MKPARIEVFDPAAFGAKSPDGLITKSSHAELQIKAEGEDGRITGYGSIWEKVDSYNEATVKGCFRKSLTALRKSKKPLKMLWQHDSGVPIGKWDVFQEDDKGLYLEGAINLETQRGQDAWSDIKFGSLDGLSIGYREIKADPWGQEEPRKLYELDLREVSVVTFPALKEAQLDAVKARLARGERLTVREFEQFVRDELNLSSRAAKEIASLGYRKWLDRDGQAAKATPELSDASAALAELASLANAPLEL